MSNEITFTGIIGSIKIPGSMEAYEYSLEYAGYRNPYEGRIEVETFSEEVHITLKLPDGSFMEIPRFRLRYLKGDMLPVYCESGSSISYFSIDKP